MPGPKVLQAFTADEAARAHELLALKVAHMMGRKLEEGDWAEVYCRAKKIPLSGWSNLHSDVMHAGLVVEHKMLCYRSKADIREACGLTLMHPSATRSIRVPTPDTDPDDAMRIVFGQYADLIKERRQRAIAMGDGHKAAIDMRTGWLLWQQTLRQFLYFEERLAAPLPDRFRAEWVSSGGGARKPSVNLWVYDRKTGEKRFSITTSAGAKIQPYFDVPPVGAANLYVFTVIGEVLERGMVRVWLTQATARELVRLLGSLDPDAVHSAICNAAGRLADADVASIDPLGRGESILIPQQTYDALKAALPGVNDDHSFQMLAALLRSST